MAVDTPVLENRVNEKNVNEVVPARRINLTEEEHNARIKDTYARLINPNYNRVEDVFDNTAKTVEAPVMHSEPVQAAAPAESKPYFVENARATAAIFRADSAINASVAQPEVMAAPAAEEENEDLRPTSTTIQYQTIGKADTKIKSVTDKRAHTFGKKEKILLAAFVVIIVALITLVIVNSAIINNLNSEIATVQDKIVSVRGAINGVTSNMEQTLLTGLRN